MAQAILPLDAQPADTSLGFELGWDFAHHALRPPVEPLATSSSLRRGWESGRATFGTRTLSPTRPVRQWLQLRLDAWQNGRAFEGVQVSPNYLRQIDVAWCPITREAIDRQHGDPDDGTIVRVRDDAGYAAGNLVVMSLRASVAKGRRGFEDALALMRLAETLPAPGAGRPEGAGQAALLGLDAAQWARLAVLCSFVTELPHAQATALPLLVLPPNRVRLFNPIQALQALVTRQFGQDGWSTRLARIEALLPGASVRRDFQRFVHALLPRILERGRRCDAQARVWALEDAWRHPLVLRCWMRLAGQLSPGQAEQAVLRAGTILQGARCVQAFTMSEATEGWALDRGGCAYEPVAPFRSPPRTPRRESHALPPGRTRSVPVHLGPGG